MTIHWSQLYIEKKLPDDSALETNQVPIYLLYWRIISAEEEHCHFLEELCRLFRDDNRDTSGQLGYETVVQLDK